MGEIAAEYDKCDLQNRIRSDMTAWDVVIKSFGEWFTIWVFALNLDVLSFIFRLL